MNIICKNLKLDKISRFDFLLDGKESTEDIGTVQLMFSNNTVLELELVPDGESVTYTFKELNIVKKEDEKTDWFRIDLTERVPYKILKGQKVTNLGELLFGIKGEKEDEMVVAGIGLRFEKGDTLIYYNDGDFAKIFVNETPPDYEVMFKLVWKQGEFITNISPE